MLDNSTSRLMIIKIKRKQKKQNIQKRASVSKTTVILLQPFTIPYYGYTLYIIDVQCIMYTIHYTIFF